MPKQKDIFEVDLNGRLCAKLGLAPDNENLIEALRSAKRLHAALAMYQIGVVDCEMKRLSASDRSSELTRLWAETYMHYDTLGRLLGPVGSLLERLEGEVNADIAKERKARGEMAKLDKIDEGFNDLVKGGMPTSDEPGPDGDQEL